MAYKHCVIVFLLSTISLFVHSQSNIQLLGQAEMHLDTKSGKLQISIDSIKNFDTNGISGDLRLRLYFLPEKYQGNTANGYLAGEYYFTQQIPAASTAIDFKTEMPFYEVPTGKYYKTICLEEKVAEDYQIINYLNFKNQSEVKYPELNFNSFEEALNQEVRRSVYSISGKCIDENIQQNTFPNLASLNIKCRDDKLPDNISRLSSIKHLELNMPNIENLPNDIGNLNNLEKFSCTISSLKTLPESISEWEKLKSLNIAYTAIQELPESIGELKSLEKLNLNDNEINRLPESFTQLKSLKTLEMNNTNIKSLPTNFGALSNLEHLECRNIKISELPASFEQLKKLKYLDISGSNINKISNKLIKSLDKLAYLNLSGSSLSDRQIKRIRKHLPEHCKLVTKIKFNE
jgi:Leucine-rich repeat (LRR) protein